MTLRIYYFTNLWLFESVTLRIYYFTNLWLYESSTLRIHYFTNLLLYESSTLRIHYFTNVWLYESMTLRIYDFTNLWLYESITLRIYYFTSLFLWAFLKVRNSEVSHPNFLWLYRPTAFSVFVLPGKPSPPQSWQQGCAPLARHAKVEDAAGADEPHSMELQCYQQANGIHSLMMLPHPLASTPLVLARYRTDTEPQVLLPSAHQRSTGWWLHLCDFLSSEMGQEQRIPQQSEPRTPLRCVQRWPPLLLKPAEGHTQRACSF